MLPTTSQGSIAKGIWLVHNDGVNTIRFFGSNTGKEKVFLNEELVSERRNLKLQSVHEFQDDRGNNYEIRFTTTSIFKGSMLCSIYKNTELIKNFTTSFRRGKNFTLLRFLILILVSIAYTIISVKLKLPEYVFFIFLFVLFTIHFSTRKPTEIIIEED
ncbi:hypothetical protein KORDIASMS9_04320 [Kordia sp. SMS9]|uniref:hypothetical protein n=1 Tax=Kordia sp. SMS9 TaxID=2282170 RepID=UPI000E0DEFE4|nr:hypothetical protein [Kordia sp. SMS9]AXG72058.1 hypothetical protein KORDIASMS9_04320 [Kordia sp. SMS9]